MIIEGFSITSQGNSVIRVSNDFLTESFTIVTHKNLPFAHSVKHQHLWKLTDYAKTQIEKEVRAFISLRGTDKQKDIVFGKERVRSF